MIKNGLTKRFAEIGKIKIGGKGETRKGDKGKTYQLPVRFDHFVVTTTEKGKDGNFIKNEKIMKALGEKPKEIPIRFPFDDMDMNFFTSFQYYHGKKCVCKGDGIKADRIDTKGVNHEINCDPYSCEFLLNGKCKPSGILSCHITSSMEVGGIYRFRTHSWNTISSIMAALEYFAENTNGVLQGLPFKLQFLKKATAEHGNVNIVTLVLDGVEMMKMRDLAYVEYENRMKLGIDMKQIENQAKENGVMTETDDPEDIEVEFYTDADDVEPIGNTANDATEKLKDKKEKPVVKSDGGGLL